MDPTAKDNLAQLDNLLAASNQSWLFGAGISLDAGIPLMRPLTDRVLARAEESGEANDLKVLASIKNQLSDESHIEHILSQLGDHKAIAGRSKEKTVELDDISLSVDDLDRLHQRVLTWIAETIRWGYKPKKDDETPEEIGTHENRIIVINDHSEFVYALFNRSQADVAERPESSQAIHHQLRHSPRRCSCTWRFLILGRILRRSSRRIEAIDMAMQNQTSAIEPT